MKRAIAVSIFVLVLLVAVGFFVTRAEAETVKYKITSYLTKVEMIPVPDVENHFIGAQERRGVAIFENGETAAYHMWCTLEFISGQGGSYKGYSNSRRCMTRDLTHCQGDELGAINPWS